MPVQITPAGVIWALACKTMCSPTRKSKVDLIFSGWAETAGEGSFPTTDIQNSASNAAIERSVQACWLPA
jgi:hypothetical protein